MVDFNQRELLVSVQANLLNLNRTSLYYKPVPPDETDLQTKRLIDQIYMQHPEFGYRRMTVWLNSRYGLQINHKAVYCHMQQMGIQAIYPRQNTSKPNSANKVYPYLLKDLDIDHANYVWSIDITYIPIKKSWLYLTAVIDWNSRYVISWKIDDTLEIPFILKACRKALHNCKPEIMNSDQGSHFTSPKYTEIFLNAGAKISMTIEDVHMIIFLLNVYGVA